MPPTEKTLKRYIKTIIDEHAAYVAFGEVAEATQVSESVWYGARSTFLAAEQLSNQKRQEFNATYTSSFDPEA